MRKPPSVLLSLLVILLLFPSCHKETEEDKVRRVITDVQKSAEEKRIMSILEHISKTYQDPQGNNYDGIKGLLTFYFFQHQKVSVFIPDIEIVVTGPTAKATFQAILTGRGTGEAAATAVLPEALGAYSFEVHFKQEEGRWKATSATWERPGE
jgi:hypothetical protein